MIPEVTLTAVPQVLRPGNRPTPAYNVLRAVGVDLLDDVAGGYGEHYSQTRLHRSLPRLSRIQLLILALSHIDLKWRLWHRIRRASHHFCR